MQVEFREQQEYAYAVARVRALENRLVDSAALSSLLTVPNDRFLPLFLEATGIGGEAERYHVLIDHLEAAYTETFLTIKGLVLEEDRCRLLSLEYDYRLLGEILKRAKAAPGPDSTETAVAQAVRVQRPEAGDVHGEFEKRSGTGYADLEAALRGGKHQDVGETMLKVYRSIIGDREAGGREIDSRITRAYYREVFDMLEKNPNEFLKGYFERRADMHNIDAMLRVRLQERKRAALGMIYLPFGTLDMSHLEAGFEAPLESFAGMIVFSPMAPALARVDRSLSPDDQVAAAERLMEERITRYLRESLLVVFGIEPLFSYLWLKQMELINLRLVIMGRLTRMSADDIKKHLREY